MAIFCATPEANQASFKNIKQEYFANFKILQKESCLKAWNHKSTPLQFQIKNGCKVTDFTDLWINLLQRRENNICILSCIHQSREHFHTSIPWKKNTVFGSNLKWKEKKISHCKIWFLRHTHCLIQFTFQNVADFTKSKLKKLINKITVSNKALMLSQFLQHNTIFWSLISLCSKKQGSKWLITEFFFVTLSSRIWKKTLPEAFSQERQQHINKRCFPLWKPFVISAV